MKLRNNEGERASTRHLLSPNEFSTTGIGLHLIKLLAKGIQKENPQVDQVVAKTKGCSSQIDSKACLLKATPTQLIRHRKIELVPT